MSCRDVNKKITLKPIIINDSIEKPIKTKPIADLRQWDIPNEKTTTEILKSNKSINDTGLISILQPYLDKQKFKIEDIKLLKSKSYKNCKDNIIITIAGNGIKQYYVKRTETKPENYYPDFTMRVYQFENNTTATNAKNKLLKAFESANGYCNGKEPNYIIIHKNKMIHLTTRAEMFRGYLIDIKENIKKDN